MTHSGNPYADEKVARLEAERAARRAALRSALGPLPGGKTLRGRMAGALRAIADRVDNQPRPVGSRPQAHHQTASIGQGFPR